MGNLLIVALLIIAVFFLSLKLFLMKQQIRKITKQMEEQEEGLISVDFVDRELLQQVKAEAQKSEKTMKSYISMISHDMRTPLTSVIGYLQLARKTCKEEETLQNIEIALDRAKYSNKLVDEFFELSVIDSNQHTPVMEKVNICEVVCEEILANYFSFERKGITPQFEQADHEILVWADRKWLTRVVQNLISNGIKYSTDNVIFTIAEGERIVLSVSNPTLRSIDTEKIFDKFYRADVSRNSDGTGLGLYICRKLIEEMKGNITACGNDDVLTIKVELNAVR